MQQEKLHIGDLIKSTLEQEGRSVKWLAKEIHCKGRNIYNIFNRTSIDTLQLLKICFALRTNFFVYYSEIYENKFEKTEYIVSKIDYKIHQDEFHIGGLIKKMLEDDERSVNWLAKMIHCKRRNVYDIFNRSSIDTAQLMSICKALKTNLFVCFCELYRNKVSAMNNP